MIDAEAFRKALQLARNAFGPGHRLALFVFTADEQSETSASHVKDLGKLELLWLIEAASDELRHRLDSEGGDGG